MPTEPSRLHWRPMRTGRVWCMCPRSERMRIQPAPTHGRRPTPSNSCWRHSSTVIMRPSILFGPEDDFFNRFAALARISPALPLIGGGLTRFQPAFVGDVAAAIADAVDGKARAGTIYELGGPDIRAFKELMQFVLATIERKRLLMNLPFPVAKLQATLLQYLPKPLLTPDQVELLRTDNVVSETAKSVMRSSQGLGIEAEPIEAIVPSYSGASRDRAVPQTPRLAFTKYTARQVRRRPPGCATMRTARSCDAARSRGMSSPQSSRR